ncbi:hypothetical protein O6H91_16G035800 [Diphasiastrum complanatum]|uniref:Uncharacterized protein n=1 Tax=Diphasiastrum complanatum TaxID=34168 RepID=A0ACC2BBC8_DIPCM|nr:hypothetical protein O6H91_16G035800 [Diphasiastrum complanatum]
MMPQSTRACGSVHPCVSLLLWLIIFFRRLSVCQILPPPAHFCNESCDSLSVPYPFGIRSGCGLEQFKLFCVDNHNLKLALGSHMYKVLNFTTDSIIIDPLISHCGDPNFDDFTYQSSNSYRISSRNYLVMYSCRNMTSNSCSFREYTFPKYVCNLTPECCYDLHNNVSDASSFNLSSVGCSSFASWITDFFQPDNQSQLTVHVEYGMELNWAIPGNCSTDVCQNNARCVDSRVLPGYNCLCEDGFVGNPYEDHTGCHPVMCDSETMVGCLCPDGKKMGVNGCKSEENTTRRAIFVAGALLRRRNAVVSERRCGVDMKQLALLLSSNGSANNVIMFSYKDLDKATKGFAASEILGHGAHGTVYAGKLQDGRPVAVKKINNVSPQGVEQVLNEVMVLSTVRHHNLVLLYGCCLEVQDPLLVYEFVPNGTLSQHLQQERGKALDWYTRITIATEAAQGLAYLHSEVSPPIYHRDVKSSNILLDFKYNTKVADFGLSKLVLTEGSHISTVPQGTPGYLDPEYHQNFHLSDKSDVYSFGVVLIEIITAMKVVDFSREQREVNLAALALSKISSGTLKEIIDPFLDANSHPLIMCLVQRVAELAFRCLSYDKDARPTMVEVVEDLEQIRLASTALAAQSPVWNMTAFSLDDVSEHCC